MLPDLIDFLLEGPAKGFSILYVLVSDYISKKTFSYSGGFEFPLCLIPYIVYNTGMQANKG